jgi:hypothetical protein
MNLGLGPMSSTVTPFALVFDAECVQCSRVARAVRESARKPIEILSIRDHRASELLGEIYPSGWEFRPYLICSGNEGLRAFHGIRLGWELLFLVGLRGSLHVWSALRGSSPQSPSTPASSGRRRFLVQAGLLVAALAAGIRLNARQVEAGCPVCCNDASYYYVQTIYCYYYCGGSYFTNAEEYDLYDNCCGVYCGTVYLQQYPPCNCEMV